MIKDSGQIVHLRVTGKIGRTEFTAYARFKNFLLIDAAPILRKLTNDAGTFASYYSLGSRKNIEVEILKDMATKKEEANTTVTLTDKLMAIQQDLKVPKNHKNEFGGFNYRKAEDILEGLKPILKEYGAAVVLSDEIVPILNNIYVRAIATLMDCDSDSTIVAQAWAQEPAAPKPKMDSSQTTGSASSYARKYALNGLFLLDDSSDADSESGQNVQSQKTQPKNQSQGNPKTVAQPTAKPAATTETPASDKVAEPVVSEAGWAKLKEIFLAREGEDKKDDIQAFASWTLKKLHHFKLIQSNPKKLSDLPASIGRSLFDKLKEEDGEITF